MPIRRNHSHLFIAASLIAIALTPAIVQAKPPTPHSRRAVLRNRLSSVKDKLHSARTALKAAKREEAAIQTDLFAVRKRLAGTRARLADAKDRLKRTQKEQTKAKAVLAESQNRLHKGEITLARRMAANYRQGPVRYASVLLASRSMGDLLARGRFVRSIMDYDAKLIAQIKKDRQAVLDWKQRIDAKAKDIQSVKTDLAARQADEAQDVLSQKTLLAEAKAKRAELEDDLQALQNDSEEIAAKIRSLADTPVGRARRLIAFTGRFAHPVAGPITSGFGMRFHPILHYSRMHTGIDFGVGYGTPIGAAASGIVSFAGTMRGYGNVIVVDHGGGLSTLYAHCSALLVGQGATVAQGQTIARVGASGLATGPHLHFELRRNGSPVDPMGAL